MIDSDQPTFVWSLLVKADVVEDPVASNATEPPGASDPSGTVPARHAMLWHWPVGSRRLLAVLLAVAATSLLWSQSGNSTDPRPGKAVPDLVLDANTAPARVLGALPHVGPALVRNWTAAREFRPFASLNDLEQRVKGLGPVSMRRIAPHVRVAVAAEVSTPPVEETEQVPKQRASQRKTGRKAKVSP